MSLRDRQIDAMERLRELLRELEQSQQLSAQLHEQLLETRLRIDHEIEELRAIRLCARAPVRRSSVKA